MREIIFLTKLGSAVKEVRINQNNSLLLSQNIFPLLAISDFTYFSTV